MPRCSVQNCASAPLSKDQHTHKKAKLQPKMLLIQRCIIVISLCIVTELISLIGGVVKSWHGSLLIGDREGATSASIGSLLLLQESPNFVPFHGKESTHTAVNNNVLSRIFLLYYQCLRYRISARTVS